MAHGTMHKRSKDAWAVIVPAGKDPVTGKYRQRWETVRRGLQDNGRPETDHQLEERARRQLHALLSARFDEGRDITPSQLTVADFLDAWLEGRRANLGERTYSSYRALIKHHIKPVIGGIRLRSLHQRDVRRVYAEMERKGRSGTTALHCHRVLRMALQHAMRDELVTRNVADLVEAPRSDTREVQLPTIGELGRLLEAADAHPPYGQLTRLTLWTGLRLGEALGLRWQDVDLDAARLHVRQTYGQDGKFRPPKTKKSRRTIALAPEIVTMLREHKRQQAGHDLVFTDEAGQPLRQYVVNVKWQSIRRAAGVPNVRFHDLRHAAATFMLNSGEAADVVARRLGHSTPSTTLGIYSHLIEDEDKRAATVMSRVLIRKR